MALKNLAFEAGQTLLSEVIPEPMLEAYDKERLNRAKISYKIVAIDAQKKNDILKSKINVSEKEIQEKFNADFLSKDPKAELTKTKREGILNTIINERKPEVEKEWIESLKGLSSSQSLENIAKLNFVKIIEIKKVSALENLNSVKPKDAANLAPLQESDEFHKAVFSAEIGKVSDLWEIAGSLYFVAVSERELPDMPPSYTLIKEKKNISDFFNNDPASLEKSKSETKTQLENLLLNTMIKIERQNTDIIYYPGADFKEITN